MSILTSYGQLTVICVCYIIYLSCFSTAVLLLSAADSDELIFLLFDGLSKTVIVRPRWVDQGKNANNLALLHAIFIRLALINCMWKFGYFMDAPESSLTENAILHIGNGIPFAFFAFLAHQSLAYRKFNTGIFDKWSSQCECNIVLHLSLTVLWPFPLWKQSSSKCLLYK